MAPPGGSERVGLARREGPVVERVRRMSCEWKSGRGFREVMPDP